MVGSFWLCHVVSSYAYIPLSVIFNNSDSTETILLYLFGATIVVFLVIDLGYLNKQSHKVSTRSAFYQSVLWILVSSAFGLLIYLYHEDGAENALAFFSCYLTEKALSVDNIFVILLILKYFQVDEKYYHKVLFWGILGAVVFRGIFIFLGTFLIAKFYWILYIFGFFLIYSGFKVFFEDDNKDNVNHENNIVLKVCKKYLPMTSGPYNGSFIVFNPKFAFTPLFLVLILIETTDLIFAMDSIPAVFTITQNDFIIYTSNIFAVLGLRAMFFLLSGVVTKFYLLHRGLSIILFFIGVKMLIEFFNIHIPIGLSFIVILITLASSIIFSVVFPKKN